MSGRRIEIKERSDVSAHGEPLKEQFQVEGFRFQGSGFRVQGSGFRFYLLILPEAFHSTSDRIIDSHHLDQLCDEKNSFHFVIESCKAHISAALAHGS